MSKQYFTKWLSGEGETKEGDYFQTEDGDIYKHLGKGFEPTESEKKVKLFLCSRNINAGDEVLYQMKGFNIGKGIYKGESQEEGILSLIVAGDDSVYAYYPGHNPISEHPYKIIGEISAGALGYVKEGDEFSPENVFPNHTHDQETGEIIHINELGEPVETPIYKIKGPCGHFH